MKPLSYNQARLLGYIRQNPGNCLSDAVRVLNTVHPHEKAYRRYTRRLKQLKNRGLVKDGPISETSRLNGTGLYSSDHKESVAQYLGIFGLRKVKP
jgi:hypothetical protein